MPATQPISKSRSQTHIDMYDKGARQAWAERFNITEQQLRKTVQLAGSRISMVAGHLGKP